MKQRWIVLVKPPDDHPGAVRIFGPFRDREGAKALCEKVRAKIEHDVSDETTGYAYVLPLEAPRVREAIAWATRGEL